MSEFTTAAAAAADVDFRTWATFALIVIALVLYATEKLSIEVTSIGVICFLLIFFQAFPEPGPDGANELDAIHLIDGFSNPALITVLALLVIGHGMVRTGTLEYGARLISRVGRGRYWPSVTVVLVTVVVVSAFLNNIPVVVIFIPILQMLSERMGHPAGKIMMGLSFVAVLGGSTTLIGSGSNLLVSGALRQAGEAPFGFFDFTVPGLVLAAVGLAYVLLVAPRLLPDRESLASRIMARGHKYFLAQIAVDDESPLVGMEAVGGVLTGLKDARLRMIIRGDRAIRPPFHDFVVEAGDVVVLAASRDALARAEATKPGMLETGATDGVELEAETERMLAEVMVVPASSLRGQFIGRAGFQRRTRCIVLGIQRRAHMFRSQIGHIPLREGDVLLMQGHPDDIAALRNERDVVVLEGSSEELPALHHAASAGAIFLAVVAAAATGALPIVGAALTGAVAMVATGVLNVAQAARALDSRILTMIPATLAMGLALQKTGGAAFLAHGLISLVEGAGPAVVLSGFFLIAAALANVISSNACAVLFTPIAVGLAREIGVDVHVFATAVVLAANCAFATPIGYQTNLLVMGPGHYRFGDFPKVGVPLVAILWIVFSLFAPLYWDL